MKHHLRRLVVPFGFTLVAAATMATIGAFQSTAVTLESETPRSPGSALHLVAGSGPTAHAVTNMRRLVEARGPAKGVEIPLTSLLEDPLVTGIDNQGRVIAATSRTAHVFDPAGRELATFPVMHSAPTGLAVLSGDEFALAISAPKSRIHILSVNGARLAEFGSPKALYNGDQAQNWFMNQGLLVAGPDASLFFVFRYAPEAIVEHWSRGGQLLREFSVDGAAIRRQREAINARLAARQAGDNAGGLSVVTAASFDPETNHLWFATTAGDVNMPNVYEYTSDGQKLAEYRLHSADGFLPFVTDILVRGGTVHVVSNRTLYAFPLPRPIRMAARVRSTYIVRTVVGMHRLLETDIIPAVFADFACGAAQETTCTGNCSTTGVVDCADPPFWNTGVGWVIVGNNCNIQPTDGGKCTQTVTTCHPSTGDVNHGPVNEACPLDHDRDGHAASEDCNDNDGNVWTNCKKEIGEACEYDEECSSGICNDQSWLCSDSESPILVDVVGNGFRLTDSANGVDFDIDGDGAFERVAWTIADRDDAWLSLDRDGNGTIDDGTELFGDSTAQPPSSQRNGFAALAMFDQNGDGWIDNADNVYAALRLWTDSNHDGVSQASELRSLQQAGLLRLSLRVKTSERRDRYGNSYRYRAPIVTAHPRDGGPFAYDVFLTVMPLDSASR